MIEIKIRNEEEKDYYDVELLTQEAFWNLHVPGCDEHYLLHVMRTHPDFVKELDFVAEYEGKIIGNIVYSKSYISNEQGERIDTLTFGPISVHPDYQRKGIGTQLIQHSFEIVKSMNIPFVIIDGHPGNYVKHGFVSCKDYNICTVDGKFPFGTMIKELSPCNLRNETWQLHYSDVYEIKTDEVAVFDKKFPPKEKGFKYSQVEFSMACRAFIE